MKLAIFTSLVASASAFAPSASKAYNTALNGDTRSPDGLGVDPGPLDLFDPLDLLDLFDFLDLFDLFDPF